MNTSALTYPERVWDIYLAAEPSGRHWLRSRKGGSMAKIRNNHALFLS